MGTVGIWNRRPWNQIALAWLSQTPLPPTNESPIRPPREVHGRLLGHLLTSSDGSVFSAQGYHTLRRSLNLLLCSLLSSVSANRDYPARRCHGSYRTGGRLSGVLNGIGIHTLTFATPEKQETIRTTNITCLGLERQIVQDFVKFNRATLSVGIRRGWVELRLWYKPGFISVAPEGGIISIVPSLDPFVLHFV